MTAAARQAIADAANNVAGITCHPYYIADVSFGAAYVQLDRTEYESTFGTAYGRSYWSVAVIFTQDRAESAKHFEDIIPALVNALSDELVVTRAEPQRFTFTGVGETTGALITGHREDQ